MPPFAKPTATAVLRNTLKNPELSELRDMTLTEHKLRETLASHEQMMQAERATDPGDFPVFVVWLRLLFLALSCRSYNIMKEK